MKSFGTLKLTDNFPCDRSSLLRLSGRQQFRRWFNSLQSSLRT